MRKYELTDEHLEIGAMTLYRIRALKDFSNVRCGEMGGYIQNEENLSHDGNTWVSVNARVYGDARVSGDARVFGNALVSGDARVYGDAWVSGNARVSGDVWVSGDARVYGDARVSGDARVYGDAWVSGDARVFGNALVSGNARVSGDARVEEVSDVVCISPIGSENGIFTAYKQSNGLIGCNRGCFFGTLDEFQKAVEETHEGTKFFDEYMALINLVRLRLS